MEENLIMIKTKYRNENELFDSSLRIEVQIDQSLSRFGKKKLQYLIKFYPEMYYQLSNTGQLIDYLLHVDQKAQEMYEQLVKKYMIKRNITEELKMQNQMLWVQEMNNIRSCVEEIIYGILIYNKNENSV